MFNEANIRRQNKQESSAQKVAMQCTCKFTLERLLERERESRERKLCIYLSLERWRES
jgi:hypothetical protein